MILNIIWAIAMVAGWICALISIKTKKVIYSKIGICLFLIAVVAAVYKLFV